LKKAGGDIVEFTQKKKYMWR